MAALQAINLGIAFLLELCMLGALAYWGFQGTDSVPLKLLLGIGVPIVVIVIWARFMAPNSSTRLTGTAYLLLKLVLFGAAAIALAMAGQATLAIIFAVVAVVNQVLLMVWKQETIGQPTAS
jgi:hypothetical protein